MSVDVPTVRNHDVHLQLSGIAFVSHLGSIRAFRGMPDQSGFSSLQLLNGFEGKPPPTRGRNREP